MEKILVEGSTWKLIDKARAKRNDGRMVLEGVYLSDTYLAATNGRILITVDRDLIGAKTVTPGAYNVIAVGKQDKAGYKEIILEANEQEYPDIEKVIPKTNQNKVNISLCTDDHAEGMQVSRAVITLFKRTGSAFSIEWLKVLTPLNTVWTAYYTAEAGTASGKSGKSILLTAQSDRIKAIMLPFSMD